MSITDQIHNYYEAKVADTLVELASPKGYSHEEMVDLACLALNNLPTRYYRHEVDLAFYMSAQDHEYIHERVRSSVLNAMNYLDTQKKKKPD